MTELSGKIDNGKYAEIEITDFEGRSCNINGYISFKLKNQSKNTVNAYAKVHLYSKQNLLAATDYIEILDFKPQEEKTYQIKFSANEIASYNISLVSEVPDKTNIINLFGWELDLTNIFGLDLSNIKIFGVKLTEMFSWENVKTAGGNAFNWIKIFLADIPWWGYAIGGGIVLWHLPKGFLFGVFPF